MLELDPSLISDFIDSLSDLRIDANLDIGHAHCNSKVNVLNWIEKLGKRIGYVHFHDNHGKDDEHLGLGKGTIPMIDACNALNQLAPQAYWAIEAEDKGITTSLDWLNEHNFL